MLWTAPYFVTYHAYFNIFVDIFHFSYMLQQKYCIWWNCDWKHTSSEWYSTVCYNLTAYWVSHAI